MICPASVHSKIQTNWPLSVQRPCKKL